MRILAVATMLVPVTSLGSDWVYESDVDAFTDSETHTARTSASDVDGFAVARCADDSFELIFSVGEYIGSDDRYAVRYRIDKEPPGSSEWGVSTTGTAVFANAVEGQRLARSMMSGSTMLLEVTDYQGTPHRASYSLSGSSVALQKVLEACAVPLEEFRPDTTGISPAVVKHVDLLGPKNIECTKKYLAALGFSVEDTSSKKTRRYYEMLDVYFKKKQSECPDSGFSPEIYCIGEDLTFMQLYSDAADLNDSLRATCGELTIGQ